MSTINDIAQAPYSPTGTQSVGGVPEDSLGKEDFLTLLIAQLSHQDPMKPTDPTEFVSQLSQFSSLEQLVNIKSGLDLLAITQTAGTSAQMVSFIGKTVSFDSSQVQWSDASAATSMTYELAADATEVTARVVGSDGTVVDTLELGATNAGRHTFEFDGKTEAGKDLPEGTYTIEIAAKNAAGDAVRVSQRSQGVVSGVTFENGYPQILLADGRTLGLAQIIEVLSTPGAAPAPTEILPPAGAGATPDDVVGEPSPSPIPDLPFPRRPATPLPGDSP